MNRILKIFSFSEDSPLIFTQADFWIFFSLAYLIYAFIYKQNTLRSLYLFAVSLLFYYKTSGLFVGILLFSTVLDFRLGKLIYNSDQKWQKKSLVAISVFINLSVLAYFKYAYFFTDSYNALFQTKYEVINHLAVFGNSLVGDGYFSVDKIILPVGISFYTFQTISYSIDIYRKQIKPLKNIIDFGFFVSFFPQLVAGPIVRASDFIPQIHKKVKITEIEFGRSIFMILKGLVKKMIFADFIAMQFLDKVFDSPVTHSGFENILAMIGYSLQIYADFSGYTDIAIGIALLMGFHLPKNFNSPYKALHCGDFWKRWHISLSTWLKDYLYIPIGGNRKSSLFTYIFILSFSFLISLFYKGALIASLITLCVFLIIFIINYNEKIANHFHTNINILITMLIGGLWHGASWQFVIWGGLNGVGIIVYKYWRLISPYEKIQHWTVNVWKIFLTFIFITITRIYFRGESMGKIDQFYTQITQNMGWQYAISILIEYWKVVFIIILGYTTHWLSYSLKEKIETLFIESHFILKIVASVVVAVVCYQAFSAEFQAFIYFQF